VDAAATHLAAGGRRVTAVGFSFGGFHAARAASAGAPIDRLALVGAPVDLRVLDHFLLGPAFWTQLPMALRRTRRRARFEWPRGIRNRRLGPEELGRIRARTLVVTGARDWLVTRRHGEAYARCIDGARWVEIERGLHAEYLVASHRDRVLAILEEFCGPVP
jgi:pimeloyl-ACP methyl ester carboxylesterase